MTQNEQTYFGQNPSEQTNFGQSQETQFNGASIEEVKNSEKSQAWKVAVAAGLGLVGGASAAFGIPTIIDHFKPEPEPQPEPVPVPEPGDDEPAPGDETETNVENDAAQTAAPRQTVVHNHVNHTHHHYHNTTGTQQHQEPAPEPTNEVLPKYTIFDHDIYTLENGGQMDVAFGVTENDHFCVLYDTDLDGLANTFFEDKNDSGYFSPDEGINLSDNGIVLSMNHLPGDQIDIIVPDEPVIIEDVAVVVPVEDSTAFEGDAVVDDGTVADSALPDYTNDADLGQDNSMAQADDLATGDDFSNANEYMA
ncbi:MAG: hypothetical protein K6A98_05460 [Prevotella sp.]|nr:hypothetical protein [Prevotella sp.]MCR5152584.1 hypothetical protein [Prevotella sp.]